MTNLRSFVSVLCSMMLVAGCLPAQQTAGMDNSKPPAPAEKSGFIGHITKPYRPSEIEPIRLGNSSRLESLLRAGRLYLSLQDAIALAVENNLDVELQRYGPLSAQASLQRSLAGGLLRGIPPVIQAGPQSAATQALGSTTGGTGGGSGATGASGGGGGGGSTSTGGTVISATGTALQNLDPVFVSTLNVGHSTRPQSNTITTGLTAVAFDSQNFSNAIQKSWLTGTTASLGWTMLGVSSNNPLNDVNPSHTGNFQLQITQRVLQGFGIAVNNRNIRISKNNVRVSDLQFQLQLITTVSAVQNLYWDLVSFTEDLKVKQQALALAQKLYEDNKKQVEIGTLAPIEIVSAQAQVARRQQELLQSETVLLQQETIIKNALSRTGVLSPSIADARVVPMDSITMPVSEAIRPMKDLYEEALQTRPDLEQTRIGIENAKIGLKGSRSQLLPSLDLQFNLQNNGLAGTSNEIPLRGVVIPNRVDPFFLGSYGRVLEQLFRRNFPDYSFGFQLNIPIRNRSAQADMTLDTISLRQQELQQQKQLNQLRVDINNATIALQQARARFDAAKQERILQEQTLEAEQKKYALGASTVFFVIQYQRDLAQAQANEVAALGSYAKAEVELDRVMGATLKKNNINVDEAMDGRVSRGPTPLPPEGATK